MDLCPRCQMRNVDPESLNPRLCKQCCEELQSQAGPAISRFCDICQVRSGRVFPGLDEGWYCNHCVSQRAEELGVQLNPKAMQALEFLTRLQERLNEVQFVLQDRVSMLNEDVTGYVHQRSDYCLYLLQLETQRTQQLYAQLMARLQSIPFIMGNDEDEEAMEQVRQPGLLKSLSAMVLHRVNIQAPAVNQAMTQALMGQFVFFSDIVEIVQFTQRNEGMDDEE